MEQQIPQTLKPEIHWAWRYWNLGNFSYFKAPKKIGNAKIAPLVIDEAREQREILKGTLSSTFGGRWVPQGRYVKLMKFQPDVYDEAEDKIWQTVMSDTPDEANDHLRPLLHARGRVLIHGLGLGCVLNCVMMKPNVTHVDVVEIDEDVINLIGPFFAANEKAGRVTFHLGSCVDYKWPKGTRWDYVWHDIWSSIADYNLTDDSKAEHGISYATLHRKFGNRCDQQDSWAFERARQVRKIDQIMKNLAHQFAAAWRSSDEDDRLNMLIEVTCPFGINMEHWKFFLTDKSVQNKLNHVKVFERYRRRAQRSEMDWIEAYIVMEDRARRYAQQKVGMLK